MFENEADHKGLFTFYREQAELEQKAASEQRLFKAKSQYSKPKNHPKLKHNLMPIPMLDISQNNSQSQMNQTQKISPKKSFQKLNKAYIKQLSTKREQSPQIKPKQLASDIVVILKGNKTSKQDLKLNRLNLKYQMQEGHFLKEKTFEPLQEVTLPIDQIPQTTTKNTQECFKIKKTIKKNQSLNERYTHSKSQLENQLILNKEIRSKRQSMPSVRFQGVKKVDMLNQFHQLPQLQRSYTSTHQSSNHLVHKRIPPKVLASILKSENNEIIRHLRKAIEKEKEEQRKSSMIQRNHSFIQYGSFDYDKKELDLAKLNQKQRRMISILNKFTKRG